MITQLLTGLDDNPRLAPRVRTRATLALARAESVRLLRHPLVWTGFALSSVFAWTVLHGELPVVPADVSRLAATTGPLAVAVLLAVNLGALRSVRHDTEDLYGSAPVGPEARTAAMLGASLASTMFGVVFAVAGLAYMYAIGGVGIPHAADVLAIPALVAVAGTVGVAVARWIPRVFAGPVAAVVFIGIQLWFDSGAGRRPRLTLSSDWGASFSVPFEILHRNPSIHLLYVAGITISFAAAAMLIHGVTGRRMAAGLAGLVTATAAGSALLAPVSPPQAEHLLGLALDGETLNSCVEHEQVTYCTPPLYHGWIGHWHDTITGVLAAVPGAERPDSFTVRMISEVAPPDLGPMLPDSFRAQIIDLAQQTDSWDAAPRTGPHEVLVHRDQHRGIRGNEQALGLAVATVSDILDLGGLVPLNEQNPRQGRGDEPASPDTPELSRCTPAGQAREVVALYLATANVPAAETALRREIEQRPYQVLVFPEGTFVDDELFLNGEAFDANQAAVWSRSGAAVALQLLEQTSREVIQRLHNDWAHWTDPSTPRDELISAFGLKPPPTVAALAQQAGVDESELSNLTSPGPHGETPACI